MEEIKSLNKKEALLYMGYRGIEIPDSLDKMIDDCLDETLQLMEPRAVIRHYKLDKSDNKGIKIIGTNIMLTGESIRKHLIYSDEIFLFSTTVGNEIEKNIRKNMASDPARGVILDSCGSVAVEAVTQAAEDECSAAAAKAGLNITWRFGPGYGDLPIDIQRDIIRELDATTKIGVTVNLDSLLSPSKSETAIIGLMNQGRELRGSSCDICRFKETCNIKAHGAKCH